MGVGGRGTGGWRCEYIGEVEVEARQVRVQVERAASIDSGHGLWGREGTISTMHAER